MVDFENLKIFLWDKDSHQYVAFSLNSNHNETNPASGTIETTPTECKTLQKAIDSKLNKDGDIVEGSLEFKDACGIIGNKVKNDEYTSPFYKESKLIYDSSENCFKVVCSSKNSVRDPAPTIDSQFYLKIDDTPTLGSSNLVTSGAIRQYIDDAIQNAINNQ